MKREGKTFRGSSLNYTTVLSGVVWRQRVMISG